MKKTTLIILSAMLLLAVSCNDKEIDAINQRIDTLENVSIASLQAQLTQMNTTLGMLQSTQTQLSGYVTSLQTSVGTLEGNYTSLQSAVTALQQKDQTFENNLQDLQDAIGDSANDVKRWVESSYATLQQFTQVQTDITGIKTDIQSIFSRLDGLDQTTQTIANNLRDATADLTGKLGKCQEDIAGILEDLETLQGDMDTVKEQIAAIISAVQSVVVVPDYTDGSVKMTDAAENIIRFEVYPLSAAENLAALGVSALSLDYVETETKSDALTNIPLTAVSFDGEFLNVTADGTGLSDEVKAGTVGANARLRISDGTVVKSSEYFLLSFTSPVEPLPEGVVDLGIVMTKEDGTTYKLYWAKSNLCESGLCANPEDYGDYYAWGELEPYYTEGHGLDDPCNNWRERSDHPITGYNWASYKWCNGDGNKLTKYCPYSKTDYWDGEASPDNKAEFCDYDYDDDAARAKLGGKWRMPTDEEWTALRTQCTWTWTTQNGVNGRLVTATNGNSIFLPAAGYRDDARLGNAGSGGNYWSSSLRTDYPYNAWNVGFSSDAVNRYRNYRCYGFSVRPVYDEAGKSQNNELIFTGDALDITDYSATLTGYVNLPIELGDAEFGIMYDREQSFEDATKVVATVLDRKKFSVTTTSLEPSTTYYYKSYVQNGIIIKYGSMKSFTTKESRCPEGAVDLGMVLTHVDGTSYKLYWAKSNLSETGLCANPENYGDYYAWGETETKANYSSSTYKFGNSSFSKYNTNSSYGDVDNKTVLDHEDDVAYVKLGDNWRMPTLSEWARLRTQCTWTWSDNYNASGVKGRVVTASNGNSIFLPAAGRRYNTNLNDAGSIGVYWSSLLNKNYPNNARYVYFNSDYVDTDGGSYRFEGLPVRPVWEE